MLNTDPQLFSYMSCLRVTFRVIPQKRGIFWFRRSTPLMGNMNWVPPGLCLCIRHLLEGKTNMPKCYCCFLWQSSGQSQELNHCSEIHTDVYSLMYYQLRLVLAWGILPPFLWCCCKIFYNTLGVLEYWFSPSPTSHAHTIYCMCLN